MLQTHSAITAGAPGCPHPLVFLVPREMGHSCTECWPELPGISCQVCTQQVKDPITQSSAHMLADSHLPSTQGSEHHVMGSEVMKQRVPQHLSQEKLRQQQVWLPQKPEEWGWETCLPWLRIKSALKTIRDISPLDTAGLPAAYLSAKFPGTQWGRQEARMSHMQPAASPLT